MSMIVAAVVIILISSFVYALAFVLQHKGTQDTVKSGIANPTPQDLLKNKVWLLGGAMIVLAFVLHIAALSFGSVAIVQPLIVTELIFIPPLSAAISKARIGKKEWIAILAVAVGLAAFLAIAKPTEGDASRTTLTQWVVMTAAVLIIMAILYAIGAKLGPAGKATLFGICAGLVNTLLAIYAKGATEDVSTLFTNPLTYLTVLTAMITFFTNSIAFKSGPITASTPAMISVNPVASILISIWLFGVVITHTPIAIIGIIVSAVIVGIGIAALTKADSVHGAIEAEAEFDEAVLEEAHIEKPPQE